MTAEVAIINKSAVVLAADSAVTITVGGSEKVYNSVNKIFDLGMGCPLGLMVYGNLDFMGIPFETLVKVYRKERALASFPTISDAFDDFLSYLRTYPVGSEDEEANVGAILFVTYREFFEGFYKRLMASVSGKSTGFTTQVNQVLNSYIAERVRALKRLKVSSELGDQPEAEILQRYGIIHDGIVAARFKGMKLFAKTLMALKEMTCLVLLRSELSARRTGVVIAGFGSDQTFPSIRSVEVDGIIAGKLKFLNRTDLTIERLGGVRAGILPFAQKEMVERFLSGVDPDFESYSFRRFDLLLNAVTKKLVEDHVGGSPIKKQKILEQVRSFSKESLRELRDKTEAFKETAFTQKVLDMVLFMPKQELANMAESLVNLTSLKRRVSAERETVGGPVDVAVISKDEGFVWIKRKHYFPAELNPRYTARLVNCDDGGTHGTEKPEG